MGIRRKPATRAVGGQRRPLAETVPAWLSGIGAIGAVVVGFLGWYTVSGAGSPAPSPREPEVHIVSWTIDEEAISAAGEYIALRSGRDEVLLMGRPAGEPNTLWVHVAAALDPVTQDPESGTEDGEWEASMPIDLTGQEWRLQPIVVSGGLQGISDEALEELENLGPDAEVVLVAGEERLVGDSP